MNVLESESHSLQPCGFSRPEYWSGKPFPSAGDLPNPGIEPRSTTFWADSLPTEMSRSLEWVMNECNVLRMVLGISSDAAWVMDILLLLLYEDV